jgi:rod shape-determining protein MreC
MRNLFLIIYKFHVFLIFLVLFGFSFFLLVSENSFQRASFLGSSNATIAGIQAKISDWRSYLNLYEINEQLAAANTDLYNKDYTNFLPLSDHYAIIEDTLHQRRFKYHTARVINNSVHRQKNFITLDRGSRQGIRPEMGVIYQGAMVGVVKEVSEHFAVVTPILNNTFTGSVRMKGSGEFGILRWDGRDEQIAWAENIPKHVRIEKGDTLISSGFSTYFPPDVLVGTVDSHEIREGDNFHTISVKLFTQFRKLQYVNVVENLLQKEQQLIEAQAEEDGN